MFSSLLFKIYVTYVKQCGAVPASDIAAKKQHPSKQSIQGTSREWGHEIATINLLTYTVDNSIHIIQFG